MTQPGWPARLTGVIASQVRLYRGQQGLSAQQLADRCAKLGLEISRSTIADLENGRRSTLTTAELLVLAAALDIAPVLLVAPIGRCPKIEVLPGREMDPWDAELWVSGQARLPDSPDEPEAVWLDWREDGAIVPLRHRHEQLVADMSDGGIWQAAVAGDGPGEIDAGKTARLQRELRRDLEADLRAVRVRMRDLGLTPPPLPPELADIDQEPSRDRRK